MTFFHYFALYSPLSFVIGIMLIMNEGFPTQVCCVNARSYRSNETDMMSLLAIKAQITHRNSIGALGTWNGSIHFCRWKGVTCGKRHQRVIMLNLSSQSSTGNISPAFGNLSFLRVLDLSNNSFQGEVPFEISYLFRLEELYLQQNHLGQSIACNSSSWVDLRILRLSYNNFMGRVPFEFGSLSKLSLLDISGNSFSGSIPASFGNLSSLEELYASQNMLTGPIPDNIGELKGLSVLHLGFNNLSGSIPSTIYNLSSLSDFHLGNNSLEGVLPSNMFSSLPKLTMLRLWINKFSGSIPVSISNASNLELLHIGYNKFSGTIPNTFRNPNLKIVALFSNNLGNGKNDEFSFIISLANYSRHLRRLHVASNSLGGILPTYIGNLSTKLEDLSFSRNKISGKIPSSIGNLIGLNSLDLSLNQFTGSIPETIGNLRKLQEVGFGKNKLSGNIPNSIGNLTLLNQLWLEENHFEGSIPASLGNCKSLVLLHLYGNSLSGNIPMEVIGLSSLSKSLNLSRNHLTGPLPSEVGRLTNLVELDVSKNKLSGEIPTTLGGCLSMEHLHMDDNSFHGTIPSTLKALRGLEELNLSYNNLSGEILKDFGDMPFLQKLDLSYNDFEGEVPTRGVFNATNQISLNGNQRLCGGILDLHLPTCLAKKKEKATLSLALKVVISVVFGLFGISLVLILLWTLFFKRRKQPSEELVFRNNIDKPRNVSYRDLYNATTGFSPNNFVGMGGFGSVYKGVLEFDQTIVAVKVLDLQKSGASKSFITECETLRNIRHKNLIKVITACSSLDRQGNDFKAIVYEFMPNGSLDRWLHPGPEVDNMIQEPRILSLSQRLNIAIDVATALDYLHNQCETQIIHCDIKPSNVLLDDQMIAYVGDFGLAKIIQPSNLHVSLNQISSSSGVRGTIGYAAPEYGMGSVATIEGDVYSFGILLLEIFTGKKPTNEMFKEGLDLHGFAKMSLLKGVMEVIDQNLLQIEEKASIDGHDRRTMPCHVQKWLSSIIEIGAICSEESPRDRMSIHNALKELCNVKNLVSNRNKCNF